MRQIPFILPLRLPMMVPVDGPPMVGGPMEMSGLPSFDGGDVVPLSALLGPEGSEAPEGLNDEVPPQILDLVKALASGRSGAPPPSFPFPADGIHLKVRASEEMPAPLSMEESEEGLRIVGRLPSNLTAAQLKVKQLGNVVSVMYRLGGDMGVEQRFELEFEPEKVDQAHYKKATGDFSLDVPVPREANQPKQVHILFDETPAPAPKKVAAPKAEKPKVEETHAHLIKMALHKTDVADNMKTPDTLANKALHDTAKPRRNLVKMDLHKADAADNLKTPATLAKMALHKSANVDHLNKTAVSDSLKTVAEQMAMTKDKLKLKRAAAPTIQAQPELPKKKQHTSRDVNPTTKQHVSELRKALSASAEPPIMIEIVG